MSFGSRSLGPPNAEEKRRMDLIKTRDRCVVTGMTGVELHHILRSGLRLGHRFVVGLHRSVHERVKTRAFKYRYPDQLLLDMQDEAINWPFVSIALHKKPSKGNCDRPLKRVPRPSSLV